MDGVKPDTLTIIVIFGTRAESVVTSITPANSAFSAVTAVMLIGTSLNRSDRRCAVTIISPSNGACWAWPDCGEVASACALACAIGHNDTPTKRAVRHSQCPIVVLPHNAHFILRLHVTLFPILHFYEIPHHFI